MHMIISGLTKLIKTMGQNIGATLLLLLIIIVSIGGWITVRHLTTILEHFPTPQVEQERFGRTLAVDELVQEDLRATLLGVGADRILVSQHHNGKVDLTGLPFSYSSVTYVTTAPGIAFDEMNFSAMPLSIMSDILAPMWRDSSAPTCVHLRTPEVKNPVMKARLEANGTKQIVACPITNVSRGPVGVIVASYVHPEQIDVDSLSKTLRDAASRVSGYLSTVKKPKA